MDVGLVVQFSGLIAAAFALLASVALAVELGVAPGKISEKNKDAKDEKSVQKATNSKRSRGNSKDEPEPNLTDNSNNNSQQPAFDTVRATESGGMEALAAQQNSSAESINSLQRNFVDGLLGHRKKYDVALAILNEYKSTDVSEEDKGLLMATQAYLSATRTGSLSSGSFLLGGGGDKTTSKKQTAETARPDDTTEATSTPEKKTGERRRPPSRTNLSKKTSSGDEPNPGTARNTKRNTRS
jgi:hypothetical protein